jgi:hypothetical protein
MRRGKDDKEMMQQFGVRQNRQSLAISVTLLLLLALTVVYKRGDLFGEFSKMSIVSAQIVTIAAFVAFSFFNWRCPSCKKYLGADINKRGCKRCGTRLR